ncbi:beta-1,6-N-acetylglucosaminyltransferase [[Clostridium] aminophilum]|uniref:Peptide O-xylosyltransferase n=1 Tax=[Clostridium] aminophilum TaxID=1526 RepID=A0A1I6K5R9_9FIRM|nr:beta-1,6-N-acetylglucosaminyltransferase [[Clostridium] aminophilum]SFR86572.1 Core-2/I-Branching enzyme [[Clostridium] aminophilum]
MGKTKIAYLLLAHKSPKQINMFINQLLNYGDCDIYIHVDKKSENIISEISKNEHVVVISKYVVSWGSFEIPKACLELMRIASESGKGYTHFYFGSCQDLLVKKGLYEFLEKDPEITYVKILGAVDNYSRTSARYRVRWPKKLMIRNDWHIYRFVRIAIQYMCKYGIVFRKNRRPIPDGMTFYEGRTWFIAPMKMMNYILKYVDDNPSFVQFWEESLASDLMFFQTIIMNSPYRAKIKDELMYVNFGKTFGTMNHPLDISIDDEKNIEKSDFYCARKFDMESDPATFKHYIELTR